MKKAFSFMELVVVVIVLGLFLAAGLQGNWNILPDLEFKASKAAFVASYQELWLHAMRSSYI